MVAIVTHDNNHGAVLKDYDVMHEGLGKRVRGNEGWLRGRVPTSMSCIALPLNCVEVTACSVKFVLSICY